MLLDQVSHLQAHLQKMLLEVQIRLSTKIRKANIIAEIFYVFFAILLTLAKLIIYYVKNQTRFCSYVNNWV